jgi:1,4-dihydroxy-2-naphthoate octaprenyltransferase
VVLAMYVVTAAAIASGALSPFTAVVLLAVPRGVHALQLMSRPAPAEAPPGYVGWPLWYHRACLVHNRGFGWLYIVGLAAGAALPGVWVG